MKVGDTVVCIKSGTWTIPEGDKCQGSPQKGEEVVIKGIEKTPYIKGGTALSFEGYADWFAAIRFRKVDKPGFTNAITKELANKPITPEKIETPKRKKPELV